jgi:phage terminase small subunit
VLRELAAIAFSNIGDFASWTARTVLLKPSAALPPGAAACIQKIHAGKGGGIGIRLHDPVPALDKLARHYGLLSTGPADARTRGGAAAGDAGRHGGVVIYRLTTAASRRPAAPPEPGSASGGGPPGLATNGWRGGGA